MMSIPTAPQSTYSLVSVRRHAVKSTRAHDVRIQTTLNQFNSLLEFFFEVHCIPAFSSLVIYSEMLSIKVRTRNLIRWKDLSCERLTYYHSGAGVFGHRPKKVNETGTSFWYYYCVVVYWHNCDNLIYHCIGLLQCKNRVDYVNLNHNQ